MRLQIRATTCRLFVRGSPVATKGRAADKVRSPGARNLPTLWENSLSRRIRCLNPLPDRNPKLSGKYLRGILRQATLHTASLQGPSLREIRAMKGAELHPPRPVRVDGFWHRLQVDRKSNLGISVRLRSPPRYPGPG